jgi:methionyl-tRNA formyltransferase
MIKYPAWLRKLKDIFNPSLEYNYIKSYNLPEIKAKGVNTAEFRKKLLSLNPDIVLVGSWGEKFEKKTYDIPKIATINAHPSLLPKYRGPNPYFWVIKNQEASSGISFHLVDDNYDSGAILAQEEIPLKDSDTGESLKKRTVLVARGVGRELLKTLKEDIIIPLSQSPEKSSYYSHPKGLELDFTKSAEQNYALIRAIHPWGKTCFYHYNTAFTPNPRTTTVEENRSEYQKAGTVVRVDSKSKTLSILCEDGKVLCMKNVSLYNTYDKPFTKNYIAREIMVGTNLLQP